MLIKNRKQQSEVRRNYNTTQRPEALLSKHRHHSHVCLNIQEIQKQIVDHSLWADVKVKVQLKYVKYVCKYSA